MYNKRCEYINKLNIDAYTLKRYTKHIIKIIQVDVSQPSPDVSMYVIESKDTDADTALEVVISVCG